MRNFIYTRVFQNHEYGFVTLCKSKVEASKMAYAFNARAEFLGIETDLFFVHVANTSFVKCESLKDLSPENAWNAFVEACKAKNRNKASSRPNYIRPHLRHFEIIEAQYCTPTQSHKQSLHLIKNWNAQLARHQLQNRMQFQVGKQEKTIQLVLLEKGSSFQEMHTLWLEALAEERRACVKKKTEKLDIAPDFPVTNSLHTHSLSEPQPVLEQLFNRLEEVQQDFLDEPETQLNIESVLWGTDQSILLSYDLENLSAEENAENTIEEVIDQLFNSSPESCYKLRF